MIARNRIKEEVENIKDETISLRREIHKHPELGFEEFKTSKLVSEYLKSLDIDVQEGVAVTGVVGLIKGSKAGKTVLLRADMDALPIQELNDVPYRSVITNKMHACGHDGHTAILLAVSKILKEFSYELNGNVKLVFQPSEEKDPGGAIRMIEEGVLENPHVDNAYGLHLGSMFEKGHIVIRNGIFMAQADRFILRVQGKGAHGAYPHLSVDPIVIASNIVLALQSIVSRETNPVDSVVVSIGKIKAGDVFNVIPETAYIEGTVRTLRKEKAESVKESIGRICQSIANAYRGTAELEYNYGYPPLVNDANEANFVKEVASSLFGKECVEEAPISLGGEDMSYFLERVPGAFFWLGTRNEQKGIVNPHHSPYFDIDEDVLPLGVELLVNIAIGALSKS